MSWKEVINGYFSFTRKDRVGILVMTALIILVYFLPVFLPGNFHSAPAPDSAWVAALRKLETIPENRYRNDSFSKNQTDENSYAYQYDRSVNSAARVKGRLFFFDPNTLPGNGWKELGLRPKTIQTIQKYLQKGGHFYKPEDLQRVYGLHRDEYERLLPFVKIERTEAVTTPSYPVSNHSFTKPATAAIDINRADTSGWIALPGIGSKLAARIVNFREKLGGFYSISQVAETYGIADSVFQKIKPYLLLQQAVVKKININSATLDELKAHPYIRSALAAPIIAYRNEHGPFANITDIRKVMAVTEDLFTKIAPYLDTR